jgi:DNA mismatch repair protein MLH3
LPYLGQSLNGHGTRVVVRDLFGNMPVRVKQRALLQQNPLTLAKLWDDVKLDIVALLIPWRVPVTVKLIDLDTNKTMLLGGNLSSQKSSNEALKSSKYLPFKLTSIFNQAGLVESLDSSIWVPAAASSRDINIRGVIGVDPMPTRQLQFLALEFQPLERQGPLSDLYDHMNHLFKASDFGIERTLNHTLPSKHGSKELTPRRRAVEKFPSFYLGITFKEQNISWPTEISRENDMLSRIIDVLDALVDAWLTTNHFLTPKSRKRDSKGSSLSFKHKSSPSIKRPALRSSESGSIHSADESTSTSGSYSKVQRAYRRHSRTLSNSIEECDMDKFLSKRDTVSNTLKSRRSRQPVSSQDQDPQSPLSVESEPAISPQSCDGKPSTADHCCSVKLARVNAADYEESEYPPPDDTYLWIDPYTKKTYNLNSRTGVASNSTTDVVAPTRPLNQRLTMRSTRPRPSTPLPPWIEDIFKRSKSGVFGNTEEPIPQVVPGMVVGGSQTFPVAVFNRLQMKAVHQLRDSVFVESGTKLTKDLLRRSHVIAQVDRQFILLSVPKDTESQVLVAVDQHAADERCRVEQLFELLCTPPDMSNGFKSNLEARSSVQCTVLTKSLRFRLPLIEVRHFEQHAAAFAEWGILYDIVSVDESELSKPRELEVKALPNVIAERAKSHPGLLISFLREEMWKKVEGGTSFYSPLTPRDDPSAALGTDSKPWLRRIGRCPKGLLDMLSSRACRSAIMFNDHLSIEECQDLIERLADCAFPFQCAHGRPSMVPLIQMSSDIQDGGSGPSFLEAMESWRKKKRSETNIELN